jgi:hypothetical protein
VLILGFAPILACPAERAEALKCLSGQLQGKLTRGKVSTECRTFSGGKAREVGRALGLRLLTQWLKCECAQRKRWNIGGERSYLADDAIDEYTSGPPR